MCVLADAAVCSRVEAPVDMCGKHFRLFSVHSLWLSEQLAVSNKNDTITWPRMDAVAETHLVLYGTYTEHLYACCTGTHCSPTGADSKPQRTVTCNTRARVKLAKERARVLA